MIQKTIGIVGGMGPHSGTALFNLILDNTPARADQEYPSMLLASFPGAIPDRTLFLTGEEKTNPAYGIAGMIGKLYQAGATVIGIACNTAYSPAIYDVILTELQRMGIVVDMVNMPLETYRYIKTHHPHAGKVGVMSTNGTYLSGVYRELLTDMGYEVIVPDTEFQDKVIHRMIYDPHFGIKACPKNIHEEVYRLAERAVQYFEQRHADVIVIGCTELSLFLKQATVRGIAMVDSLQSLACALVRQATVADIILKQKKYDRVTGAKR